jgi:beta-N-acetylhexosaminidase
MFRFGEPRVLIPLWLYVRSNRAEPSRLVRDFGQLFLLAIDGTTLAEETAEFFSTFRIGGVVLFKDNYENPRQLKEFVDTLQRRCAGDDVPLLVATDHEGGRVQRFQTGMTRIPPMSELRRASTAEIVSCHRTIAQELRAVGVRLNLAPVADLSAPGHAGAIGDRSFGMDPARVAKCVRAAVCGLQMEGVLSCVKHFPGHGGTGTDSHDEQPVVGVSRHRMDRRELVPFRAAFEAGVAATMTAHIVYPAAGDREWPASLSEHWIGRVLRAELGFAGLVISDAIEMKALMNHWSAEECGARALIAGTDIVLFYREDSQFETFYRLRRRVERGEFDPALVARALNRVAKAKAKVRG